MARHRILIADQNPIIRQALIDLLQEDSEIVAAMDNGDSVFDVVNALHPDVLLLGVDLKGTTAFDVAQRLRQSCCLARIIIVSLHESQDLARAAIATGASGYVFLSRVMDDLPAAIRAACDGKVFEPKP